MTRISLQDIVTKKLNMTISSPDELICDAYYKMVEAERSTKIADKIDAFITALVALEANKQCDIKVPNLEHMACDCLEGLDMSTEDVVEFYLKNENSLTTENKAI